MRTSSGLWCFPAGRKLQTGDEGAACATRLSDTLQGGLQEAPRLTSTQTSTTANLTTMTVAQRAQEVLSNINNAHAAFVEFEPGQSGGPSR